MQPGYINWPQIVHIIISMCFNLHEVLADHFFIICLKIDNNYQSIIILCFMQAFIPVRGSKSKGEFDQMLLYGMGNGNWTKLFWN